ncbi:winged helix-turn-helix domain-containing protein [Paraburkholderia elongata]|uniref:Winged helix-turn helix domain-containing protein n=1 Tax=Paraburkholderia elongata TaxID=2675747 RepID=A0A972SHH8_9BURK|nr:winged helix-turn-helix domain-containing protein [Paraburkholderia elongata]NPT55034.1 hypothetical protein [Paraburkholderia elongata]
MKLSSEAIRLVYQTVTTKNPMQMKFEFALLTRDMVWELVREHFNVKLSEVSVGRLLLKLGLSPQRPLARACRCDPQLVECWMQEQYPVIVKLAKHCGAQIFFIDESTVRSDYHSRTAWAPIGQTPVVEATGARFKVNLIADGHPVHRCKAIRQLSDLAACSQSTPGYGLPTPGSPQTFATSQA